MSTLALNPSATLRRPTARPVRPVRTTHPTRPVPAAHPADVRLTRRGRLVLAVVFVGLLLAAFTVFGATSAATGEAGEPVPTRMVTVEEGDTLWGIAGQVAGPGEVRTVVHRIQELNALSGSAVFVGQEIAVPVE